MSHDHQNEPLQFDFAISYASPNEREARELFNLLKSLGFRVYFDKEFQYKLLGEDLTIQFSQSFGRGTLFFVPLISREYVSRVWAKREWNIAKREALKRKKPFILPLRMDDAYIEDLPPNIGYLDLRRYSTKEVADLLDLKYKDIYGALQTSVQIRRLVATFGMNFSELDIDVDESEEWPLPPDLGYAHACDWLQKDLINVLENKGFKNVEVIEDARNGETFSVRIAFDSAISESIDFGAPYWWKILELAEYSAIYPDEQS